MSARLERSIALGLNVSPEDADLLYSYTWRLTQKGYPQTSVDCPHGIGNTSGTRKYMTSLNRLVLSRMLGCNVWDIPTNIEADHRDEWLGLGNCRRENIQPLTKVANVKKKASRKSRKGAA